ncbi:MAG: hypothetical protein Kow0031_01810 [Anaerolineae bacterium]
MDLGIRHFVYRHFVAEARPPTVDEIAREFNLARTEAEAAVERLHQHHLLFLEPGTTDIRIANPFSAIPTDYQVRVGPRAYWANCAWDMLGIPAALHTDAVIEAVYTDTREWTTITISSGELQPAAGVVHFPLPVRQWYDDLILT